MNEITHHVLIVEDNHHQTKIWQLQLQSLTALSVTYVRTLDAANEVIDKKIKYDLIFLDGNLKPGHRTIPCTRDLFLKIKQNPDYDGKVFCTTDFHKHQVLMENLGCPHVKKDDIVTKITTVYNGSESASS